MGLFGILFMSITFVYLSIQTLNFPYYIGLSNNLLFARTNTIQRAVALYAMLAYGAENFSPEPKMQMLRIPEELPFVLHSSLVHQ